MGKGVVQSVTPVHWCALQGYGSGRKRPRPDYDTQSMDISFRVCVHVRGCVTRLRANYLCIKQEEHIRTVVCDLHVPPQIRPDTKDGRPRPWAVKHLFITYCKQQNVGWGPGSSRLMAGIYQSCVVFVDQSKLYMYFMKALHS